MAASPESIVKGYFQSPNRPPRPVLTSLNGDNSWLVSFPRPAAERCSSGRAFFHVVWDPWLTGPVSVGYGWIASLTQTVKPSAPDGMAVESFALEIEEAAASVGSVTGGEVSRAGDIEKSPIDAIFITSHYGDHMHEPTLRTFRPDIPVFTVPEAAVAIRAWGHFSTVVETRDLDPRNPDWRVLHPGSPLPAWLTVFRLVGHRVLYSAMVSVFDVDGESPEALLCSPHGILADQPSIRTLLHEAAPPVRVLAILHALKDGFAMGMCITSGVDGGLALERRAKPRYWIKSHDQELLYGGVVPRLVAANDVPNTLEQGLEAEHVRLGEEGTELWKPNLIEIENGSSFVLE